MPRRRVRRADSAAPPVEPAPAQQDASPRGGAASDPVLADPTSPRRRDLEEAARASSMPEATIGRIENDPLARAALLAEIRAGVDGERVVRGLERWFGDDEALVVDRGHVLLRTPGEFEAQWLRTQFAAPVESAARRSLGPAAAVTFVVDATRRAHPGGGSAESSIGSAPRAAASGRPRSPGAPSAPSVHPEPEAVRFGSATIRSLGEIPSLEDFVVGPSNALAHSAAMRIAEDPNAAGSLCIDGPCGVGKTHLLRAICARRLELHPDAQVLYVTGEAFTNEFIAALRSHALEAFRARIRRLDLLAIDDVHFLADKDKTSSEFLHTIDHIGRHCREVVLASDAPLDRIGAFSHALRSRIKAGLLVHIDVPDPELRLALVRRLAAKRNLPLTPEAAIYVATRVEGTARELEGALRRLDLERQLRTGGIPGADLPSTGVQEVGRTVESGALGEPRADAERGVNGAVAAAALRESLGDRGLPIRPSAIVGAVCTLLSIERGELLGKGRHPRVVLGRMLVTAVARKSTTLSFPEIGRLLGRDAHSTVHHAWSRAKALLASDERIEDAVETGPISFSELVDQTRRIARRPR